ncbi:flagellar biosynthetic protein FliO [Paenibacillus sp. BC26]|uniref:flagellar biosynthetic protein FliO n=1 Tax=Paenibacillus sp. BC26 TaxID=1881032 RepID=UPI0008E63F48|nr:flagellar biosynthetic protein FliO [Paenibacillus sp. BC26]SFS79200.1 flagellar protein FliO/FliZ [Paenibacillus sp. BC26]
MRVLKGVRLAAMAVSGWLLTASLASAEISGDEDKPVIGTSIGYYIWVIIALMLVVGLIILVMKWLSSRNRGWGTNRALRSLGGIPLGQNKSLQVVELSGRVYVVGVGEDITLLDKIDDPETASAILEAIEQQNGRTWNTPNLTDFIGRFRKTNKADEPTSEPWQAATSFKELLNNGMMRQSDQKQKVEELLKERNQNDRLLDE